MRTIAAISTPPGKGGIAVIRVSGDDALAVTGRVFACANGKAVSDLPARFAAFGTIHTPDGDVLDTGICTPFHGPASFTGRMSVRFPATGGLL